MVSDASDTNDVSARDSSLELAEFRKLCNRGKVEETAAMARGLLERFGEDIAVLTAVGNWSRRVGRVEDASHCFERVVQLQPENRVAVSALALGHIEGGRLDEAHRLLGFMLDPGPRQDRSLLRRLARAYQQADRHREALQIYACVLKGSAPLGQDGAFRREVRASEQGLGMSDSILPRRKLPRLVTVKMPVVALLAAAALVGAWLINSHLSTNQTLHVVNGCGQPFRVSVRGAGSLGVVAGSRREMSIAEGRHTADVRFADGTATTIEFVVENSIAQRLASDSTFVLNPRGAASLLWEQVIYTAHGGNQKPVTRVHFGKEFMSFRDVDYAFAVAPGSIRTERSREVRTRLTLIRDKPLEVLDYFTDQRPERLMRFTRHHLELDPDNLDLLVAYLHLSATSDRLLKRRKQFMRQQLARRPVLVEWHRLHQNLNQGPDGYDALLENYDVLLAEKPRSAARLYLRSRLCASSSEAQKYLERCRSGSPGCGHAHLARAYHHNSRGEFGPALRQLAAARELMSLRRWRTADYETRFALGQYDHLLKDVRRQQRQTPLKLDLCTTISELLAKKGDVAGARKEVQTYARRLRGRFPGARAERAILTCRLSLLLFLGEDAKILEECQRIKDKGSRRDWEIRAHMAIGNMGAAEKLAPAKPGEFSCSFGLEMYVGWYLAGDGRKADRWLAGAIRELKLNSPEERRLAGLLEAGDCSLRDALDIPRSPSEKATFLLALACRHRAIREPLVATAEKLNYSLCNPHSFRKRAIAELRKR